MTDVAKVKDIQAINIPGEDNWRSRITGHSDENPAVLLAHPSNWRFHPQLQEQTLEGMLTEVGWVQGVIVSRGTNRILDGHLRVALGKKRKEPTVPVTWVEVTEDEERIILASFDSIGAMATRDAPKMKSLVADIKAAKKRPTNEFVQAMLVDLDEAGIDVTIEGSPTDAAFAYNPLATNDKFGTESVATNDGKDAMRAVQIILTQDQHKAFLAALRDLGKLYGLNSVTDVLLKVVYVARAELDR